MVRIDPFRMLNEWAGEKHSLVVHNDPGPFGDNGRLVFQSSVVDYKGVPYHADIELTVDQVDELAAYLTYAVTELREEAAF